MTRTAIALALLLAVFALGQLLDGPSETDAARATSLNLHDAINSARVASKESK
jgi:hypothetical protein